LSSIISNKKELNRYVHEVVNRTPVVDMHTHLYSPAFGDLLLWGVDELLTYHYLIAETMRHSPLSYESFWAMSKRQMADHIWQTLFLDHSPYSEACRGVLTTLQKFGLDVANRNLEEYRFFYDSMTVDSAVDLVFKIANVKSVVMTNDPFDDKERALWLSKGEALLKDCRFHAALRIDPLLNDWSNNYLHLQAWGYDVQEGFHAEDERTISEVIRFLTEWGRRMNALYMAVSLPSDFVYPAEDVRTALIDNCVIPACRELNIPFAMMIGVKRQVNSALRLAGDMSGRADIAAVERMCRRYPDNRFFVTMLSRENQHELTVLARKFRNLMVFGCWWFLNNPSLVREITEIRFELLGTSVIPQHSDARVLDQLLYKWEHSRQIIASVLCTKYEDLLATGWKIEQHEIERDVADLLENNFWKFVKG
jgi:hypothetical protein